MQSALKVIDDPNILINVVSRRVKQLKRGNRPLVESLEKLSSEDIALREIGEGKITFELATLEEIAANGGGEPRAYTGGNTHAGSHHSKSNFTPAAS